MRDTLRRGDDSLPNDGGASFTVLTLTPEVGYYFPRGFQARVRLPLHWKSFEESVPAVRVSERGPGDLEALAQYERAVMARWGATIVAGAALPTGTTAAQPFVGETAPTPLQLGSGTVDPIVSGTARYEPHDRWSASASTAARLVLYENEHDYRSASVFEAGVGAAVRLWSDLVRARLHVDYSLVTRARVAGIDAPGTGRDTVFVSPGVNVSLRADLRVDLSVRVPVYQHVNDVQLSESVLFAVRISYRTPRLFE